MTWLKNTNATVSDVVCAGPEDMKDKRLNDMTSLHDECVSTGEETPEPAGIVTRHSTQSPEEVTFLVLLQCPLYNVALKKKDVIQFLENF